MVMMITLLILKNSIPNSILMTKLEQLQQFLCTRLTKVNKSALARDKTLENKLMLDAFKFVTLNRHVDR